MVLQSVWDCRWSRPGYLPDGVSRRPDPEGLWVCVRPTDGAARRPISEQECETCPHWQPAFAEEPD
jgi:hypothetical protein